MNDVKGLWWLPSSKDLKVAGTLILDGDRKSPSLELIGSLSRQFPGSGLIEHSLVLGRDTGGKDYTLTNCALDSASFGTGVPTENFLPLSVFSGHHFMSLEEIRFSEIHAEYPQLLNWFAKSGLRYQIELKESLRIDYTIPESVNVALEDAQISFKFTMNKESGEHNAVRLVESCEIVAKTTSALSFTDLFDGLTYRIQCFFTLAMQRIVTPRTITCRNEEILEDIGDSKPLRKPVSIHPRNRKTAHSSTSNKVTQYDMLFAFEDIENLQAAFSNWMAAYESIKPAFDSYFSVRHNHNYELEVTFLNLTHALEIIPRRLSENYELKFRDCVQTLISEFSAQLKYMIPNPEEFLQNTVDSRNYYTHYNPKKEQKAKSGKGLWSLNERIRFLIELKLLSIIGFSSEEISKLAERNQRYLHIRGQLVDR